LAGLLRAPKEVAMPVIQGFCLEDIAVGMSAEYRKTVTQDDIVKFSEVTGDVNPVHLDEDYATATIFKTRIAHGLLSAGFISTVFGTKLPGPGAIYVSQNLKFNAPVRIGDTVTANCVVREVDRDRAFVSFDCFCRVGDKLVISGDAVIMVPRRRVEVAAAE
jgi:3-hydroxybutyryl-CoA dehydratase